MSDGGVVMQSTASGGGIMVDGQRLGPPPDMPSLLLSNRIVYLGMPIAAQVTELIISELLYLQNESQEKPVLMYINSPGTTTEDGQPTGFETEAFAIYDTMNYCKAPVHTVSWARPTASRPCYSRPASRASGARSRVAR